MQGTAYFFGPDASLDNPSSNNGLVSIWFTAGAKTRRGVGVGSTRLEVRRAYGKHLHAGPNGLYIVGQWLPQARVRPAIYFFFLRNRVIMLGYGGLQVLRSDASAYSMPIVHC
jgi:hypothetical protein